jgi:hypothetical protein
MQQEVCAVGNLTSLIPVVGSPAILREFLSPLPGLLGRAHPTHGLRRGLHSFAALRLGVISFAQRSALAHQQMPGFFVLGVFGILAVGG